MRRAIIAAAIAVAAAAVGMPTAVADPVPPPYESQNQHTSALFSILGPDKGAAVPFVANTETLSRFGAWINSNSPTGTVTLSLRTDVKDAATEVASRTINIGSKGGSGTGYLEFTFDPAVTVTPGMVSYAVLQAAGATTGKKIEWWGVKAEVPNALKSWSYDASYWGGWQEYGSGSAARFADVNLSFYINDAQGALGCETANECWTNVPSNQSGLNVSGIIGTPGHVYGLSPRETVGAHYLPHSSVLQLADGKWLYLPTDKDTPVVVNADDPGALVQIAESTAWLAAGIVPGRTAVEREMSERALLDQRLLLQPNGAMAAAWWGMWKYSWPRDTAYAAAAFARTGHLTEALQIMHFNASTQKADGTWDARTYLDGPTVPDGREWQLDANGWVPWAMWQYLQVASPAQQKAALAELYPMIKKAADYAAGCLDANGLPPARPDYWESSFPATNLGTAAPLLAGLRAAGAVAEMVGAQDDVTTWFTAADRLSTGIANSFGKNGYQRTIVDGSGKDSAVTFLAPPFAPADDAMWSAIDDSWNVLVRPNGGVVPGESWTGSESWGPETMFFALAWMNSGSADLRDRADRLIDWMNHHRAVTGSFPEKITQDGNAASVAPLGWTSSVTTMTLASIDSPMPVPPTAPNSVPLTVTISGDLTAGNTVSVRVAGAQPSSKVSLVMAPKAKNASGAPATTATADASGAATFSVVLPAASATADYLLTATGVDVHGQATNGSLTVTVTGTSPSAPTPNAAGTGSGDGSLPDTGPNPWPFLAAALTVLMLGLGLVAARRSVAARRR